MKTYSKHFEQKYWMSHMIPFPCYATVCTVCSSEEWRSKGSRAMIGLQKCWTSQIELTHEFVLSKTVAQARVKVWQPLCRNSRCWDCDSKASDLKTKQSKDNKQMSVRRHFSCCIVDWIYTGISAQWQPPPTNRQHNKKLTFHVLSIWCRVCLFCMYTQAEYRITGLAPN